MNLETPLELVNLKEITDDKAFSFEPSNFDEYLGQKIVKEKLEVYTKACKMRSEALDHLLLFGPPGLGKTTLANVMAKELGVNIKITSGPVLERSGDLVAIISNMEEREILFIDEIHRLPKIVEESLYSAMENFCIDMIIGQGAGAKSVRLPLNRFTVIGATTKTSLISGPLQTRFGIVERLDFYESEDLAQIVMQNSKYLGMEITAQAALILGQRGRGTPRIVKRLLRRVRDFAQVKNQKIIDDFVVNEALNFLGIDNDGLNKLDRDILICMIRDFDGGPVGLETLAAMTGEDKDTIETFCEPFLLRLGLLQKNSRGRQITPKKLPYLRKKLLDEDVIEQNSLF
ncbi:TPA: Holliday junction branch migration DNA helicase RuvB [Candidatus Dependentiae bacterium]|nr:MAG: Holliday junction ATP-dependent DNA helicase RuvB [candidate division TM6 bacterium GW2011_GWE2_31_21]KKP53951.1 MAG: Holliday junction ATP-dependent DNA helicase RuvB [candidate division TM6 bacterium GW2011_GWF2_33_332]HBS47731.1 Holliday junction branch migration DNA helicase RuvB [Candidatus Dependentiae bacterium]HBZ73880.1 Holliday junction branch migration DNA helicase RuvB [Candidatus Dependentiae bacterium]